MLVRVLLSFAVLFMLFGQVLEAKTHGERQLAPCGKGERDEMIYDWIGLTKVSLHAKFININAIICGGFFKNRDYSKGPQLAKIHYRDQTGSWREFTYKELSESRKVLVTQEDIGVDLIRSGPIVGLQVFRLNFDNEEENYRVQLRFLRNLGKLSNSPNDYRELTAIARINQKLEKELQVHDQSFSFDGLDLFISLTLNMHKAEFLLNGREVASIDTIVLPRVKEIKK